MPSTSEWGLDLWFFFLFGAILFWKCLRIVPPQRAQILERLGKYQGTLHSGFHILIPFIDQIVKILDLREESLDVPSQECFTKDEIRVVVDGVIYLSVADPVRASYGVENYRMAAMLLAQATIRSVIGRLSLDQTFEERELISAGVVDVLGQTAWEWGIQVHRYEIKDLQPPQSVQASMEKQVRAERDRRALLAKSQGEAEAMIRKAEGEMTEIINISEGRKEQIINEAMGLAKALEAQGESTAQALEFVGRTLDSAGGKEAMHFRMGQEFWKAYSSLAREDTQVLLPLEGTSWKDILEKMDFTMKT